MVPAANLLVLPFASWLGRPRALMRMRVIACPHCSSLLAVSHFDAQPRFVCTACGARLDIEDAWNEAPELWRAEVYSRKTVARGPTTDADRACPGEPPPLAYRNPSSVADGPDWQPLTKGGPK